MATITILESKSNRTRCSCCGDIIPTCMKYSKIEGDKYCHHGDDCRSMIAINHDVDVERDYENEAELEREAVGRYRAAGVSLATYYEDRDGR